MLRRRRRRKKETMSGIFQDNNYQALCSEKTLQSDPKGFFMSFVEHVIASVGDVWVEEVFGKLKTDGERIRTIYEDKKVVEIINAL